MQNISYDNFMKEKQPISLLQSVELQRVLKKYHIEICTFNSIKSRNVANNKFQHIFFEGWGRSNKWEKFAKGVKKDTKFCFHKRFSRKQLSNSKESA